MRWTRDDLGRASVEVAQVESEPVDLGVGEMRLFAERIRRGRFFDNSWSDDVRGSFASYYRVMSKSARASFSRMW